VRVALADFGHSQDADAAFEASLLSSEQREGRSVTTLPYLAPERRAGAPASPAADVYALGVLLFEVLTGRLPTGLELPSELEPGVGSELDGLVKRALSHDPASRPSVAGLRRALLRALPGRAPAAAGPEADMVYVPGGFVVIGDRDDPDARPMHEVRLEPFWIDLRPVSNADYLAFVRASGASPPRTWMRGTRLSRHARSLPVSGISYEEAQAYAAWAGKRLPTEREWERAAQGPEHRRYPYGEELDTSRIHTDPRRLAPVGSYPQGASSEGVLDLTGNGWEWTSSPFRPYGTEGGARSRTIRGGYDPARPRSGSATCRAGLRPDARDAGVTFRCALDA
jgi:formylglycine-generating enzyme required for sulfatase activity